MAKYDDDYVELLVPGFDGDEGHLRHPNHKTAARVIAEDFGPRQLPQ